MSANVAVRSLVRELQNDIKRAEDKVQLIRVLNEVIALGIVSDEEQSVQKSLPIVTSEAKAIFRREHYSNFAYFMLNCLSTDVFASLTKQEFSKYFAAYFLEGCHEDSFLAICGAIQQTGYALKKTLGELHEKP